MSLSASHGHGVMPAKCCNNLQHAKLMHSPVACAAVHLSRCSLRQRADSRCRPIRRATAASAAPRWNPQNVDNPTTIPSVGLSAEEAVAVQLEALRQNDSPWPNHGVQTMYEFGEGIGGLDPSWYFGYKKDGYHCDHFYGMFANKFLQLINARTWEITATKRIDDNRAMVEVAVAAAAPGSNGGSSSCSVTFVLRRKTVGSNKGAWLTNMLLHGSLEQAVAHIDRLMAR